MKLLLSALFALALAGCGAPAGHVVFKEETVSPPVACAPDGSCPVGLLCADDGHCGEPCGVNFACNLGWYCYAHGNGNRNHDCVPACFFFSDGGC